MEKCDKCKSCGNTSTLRVCRHKICHQCLVAYVKTFESAKIKCPINGCSKFIPDVTLRECFSNDQLIIYDARCYPKNIFKCCITECPYFIAHEDHDVQFQCPTCNQPNCLRCKSMHHPGRCVIADQEVFNTASVEYIKKLKRARLEELDQTNDLIPNPESFDCALCCEFILPRKGYALRNCLHTFCRNCLFSTFADSRYFKQLVCSSCSTLLHERERRALIGANKLNQMSLEVIRSKMFNCKEADCNAVWDVGDYTGTYRCPKCKKVNCIACEYVHENQSCEEFKKTQIYQSSRAFTMKLNTKSSINCFNCQRMLIIQTGRCGALYCDACGVYVCAFTGKSVGKGGCNCTSQKPCHKDCLYGCFPDDPKKKN